MSIKNKFQLGSRLWPVVSHGYDGRAFVNPPFDVQFIWLAPSDEVMYGFTSNYGFFEHSVFATEADAIAERDRRNR